MASDGAVLVERKHLPLKDHHSSDKASSSHSAPAPATAQKKDASEPPASPADSDDTFETSSIFEDILDEAEMYDLGEGPEILPKPERKAYRNRLHEIGANPFVYETITCGKITAKKLCTAFGVNPPEWMDGSGDDKYYGLLGMLITREISKRRRLPAHRTLQDVAKLLRSSEKIMVITGAGISTSLGIPDFRSKNTGFYSRLIEMGYSDPEQVFDIHNFDDDPKTFYTLAGDILPDLYKWTPTHEFIHVLQQKNKLLTNYTQNIDNLESHAGIDRNKLIQCHGSWATATCRKCGYKIPGEEIFEDVKQQKVAECKKCIQQLSIPKPGMKRKRSSNGSSKKRKSSEEDDDSDGQFDIPQPGVMKPDITFFGEGLPREFFDRLRNHDRHNVDLVIVIGTSMKVAPVSEVPQILPSWVPQIYISRDPIRHIDFDVNILGDCDVVVAELCRLAGWDLKHAMLPDDRAVDVEPVPNEDGDAPYTWRIVPRSKSSEPKEESKPADLKRKPSPLDDKPKPSSQHGAKPSPRLSRKEEAKE